MVKYSAETHESSKKLHHRTFQQVVDYLQFNSHFPSEPGLAGVYWSKGWWRWWWQMDYWSYKSCKASVKSWPSTNQHKVFFTGRMPFRSPNQHCQRTEGKISHSMLRLARTCLPQVHLGVFKLSLTTNNSWLPWGSVAMPNKLLHTVTSAIQSISSFAFCFWHKVTDQLHHGTVAAGLLLPALHVAENASRVGIQPHTICAVWTAASASSPLLTPLREALAQLPLPGIWRLGWCLRGSQV